MKIPETEKIVMIDGNKVGSSQILYVSPGNHTYTFKIDYASPIYCNGPAYGLKAEKDYLMEDGQGPIIPPMESLDGTGRHDLRDTLLAGGFKPGLTGRVHTIGYFVQEFDTG